MTTGCFQESKFHGPLSGIEAEREDGLVAIHKRWSAFGVMDARFQGVSRR